MHAPIIHTFGHQIKQEMPALKSLAFQLTRNQDDAKDLVQETMLKALKYQSKFSEGSNLKGWLFTILKNSFINQYRRMAKRKTFIDSTENTYFLDLPSHKTDNQADLTFIRKDLEQAIQTLSPDLRVLLMLNIEGFKYQEIANELNMPIGTVKTRIFVARRILRKKLAVYGEEFGYNKQANE
jgi:RNA polymerase sigma factor (sigma-70 family)